MQEPIQITVFCQTYNHEKYIRRCLEGFVMQRTDFAFEVLVHDDASTDGTADIVREFEAQYPDIIKPIYQTKNQYSQDVPIFWEFMLPVARGRYFAWCEGDDCWTDPDKLQKQYDFLSAHPDYAICAHKAVFHDLTTGQDSFTPDIAEDRDYSAEEVIRLGGGVFLTSSIIIKREVQLTMPECFFAPDFGDIQMVIYGAIYGKFHCLHDVMSLYNYATENSWTRRNLLSGEEIRIRHRAAYANMLSAVDKYYNGKYHEAITPVIEDYEYERALFDGDFKKLLSKPLRNARRRRRSLLHTVYFFVRAYFPRTYALYKRITGGSKTSP